MTSSLLPITEGRVSVLGTIHTLLSGYSGGITILREMAQNTDDVPSHDEHWLEFYFESDRLIIKNSTVFRPEDFVNINNIAHGGKRLEQRNTIGKFGVGFISVYQLTDTPVIRSNGCEQRMVPSENGFPIYQQPSSVVNYTEFELPYRRQHTRVGELIGMPSVTDHWLDQILAELPDEAYRLLFFLRRLRRIAIYHHGQRISEVRREDIRDADGQERLVLVDTRGGARPIRHTWLRFSAHVDGMVSKSDDSSRPKDPLVQIVIPDTDVPEAFLRSTLVGRIYNYLPTDITTGLPFHVNGDFYPSTDRKSIDNDHPNHEEWNTRVLHALGECVAEALPILLARFAQAPLHLYQRLDIRHATPLVAPIVGRLYEAARTQAIFATASGWQQASATRWIQTPLRKVAYGACQQLMDQVLQEAAEPFIKRLGVAEFTFGDLLAKLQNDITPGKRLAEGPVYMSSLPQLEAVYDILDSDLAHGYDKTIQQTPIFLDHTGRLWPADKCVYTDDLKLRDMLAEVSLHFWAGNPDRYRAAAHFVDLFTLNRLWKHLEQIPVGVPLSQGPSWLNSPAKLYQLYRAIRRIGDQPNKGDIAHLAVCLNRQRKFCRPKHVYHPDGNPILFEIFADDPDTPLIDREIYGRPEFRELYEDFGVPPFTLDMMLDRLEHLADEEVQLEQAHISLNSRAKLLRIYRYLHDHRSGLVSETKHIEELRHRLPIWICRDGWLRHMKDRTLPPEGTNWPSSIKVNDVLDLESSDGLHAFLRDVFGLKPLSPQQFVLKLLLPQYGALDSKQQMEALIYLRDHPAIYRGNEEVLRAIQRTPLIYGEDDQLHCADELCLPRTVGRALFETRLREVHTKLYAAPSGDISNWSWHDFFRALGISSFVPMTVVIETIREEVAQPPQGKNRDAIEKIFRYLEDNWERFYERTSLSAKLRDLQWLPADGNELRWYRPRDLYMRQDKPLVSHVAPVLGFAEARRPKAGIADALGFPTKVPVAILVKQLLELSQCNEPATEYLYQVLNRDVETDDQLKPLRGAKVICANDGSYWSASRVFVSSEARQFGRYRGYLTNPNTRNLLVKLGAKERPSPKDFVELLREISEQNRSGVPQEDVELITNAYHQLADADELIIASLRSLPCVLSDTETIDGSRTLHLPASVLMPPPGRFRKLIQDLPVASYDPKGKGAILLERLGVRRIEQVLKIEPGLTLDLSRQRDLTQVFGRLRYTFRRLFHHAQQDIEHVEREVQELLKRIQCYDQDVIQVTYQVELGNQTFSSDLTNEDCFYDPIMYRLYRRANLTERKFQRELAQVLCQLLPLRDCPPVLLAALIAEPEQANEILDDNGIRPLPPDLPLLPLEQNSHLEPSALGVPIEAVAEVPQNMGWLDDTDQEFLPSTQPVQTELFGQTQPEAATRVASQPPAGLQPNGTGKQVARQPAGAYHKATSQTKSHSTRVGEQAHHPEHSTARTKSGGGIDNNADGPSTKTGTGNHQPVLPQRHPDAPLFNGPTSISSPTINTDRDGVNERIRHWAEKRGLWNEHDIPPVAQPKPVRRRTAPAEPAETNKARFVLSYPEVMQGFLRITGCAQGLFASSQTSVQCETDFHQSFPLWLDWRRNPPIAYNEALRDFFLDQGIPAGGIVYLERLHSDCYRLFYKEVPHTVRSVRLAFHEQGHVRYELIDEVEVQCETVEAIYRAEKRFEDNVALWLEAVEKKSVKETLCDLLMAAPDGWLHEHDLNAMVMAERMVAASTVSRELRQNAIFASDGQNNWRLNPSALFASVANNTVVKWQKATWALLECDDSYLSIAREALHEPLADLQTRLLRLELVSAPAEHERDEIGLLALLNQEPQNTLFAAGLKHWLQQYITAGAVNLLNDIRLRNVFQEVTTDVWRETLRPALRQALEHLQTQQQYDRALALARLWAEYDQMHGLDLALLTAEADAWSVIRTDQPTVQAVLRALEIAPTLIAARKQLHRAVQYALRSYPAEHWLAQGNDECAAAAFLTYVGEIGPARSQLEQSQRPAFDRTVLEAARLLWPHLNQHGQVRLLLWLERIIPIENIQLTDQELRRLLGFAKNYHGSLHGLLLGQGIWYRCPEGHQLQPELAAYLAECHIALQIWEKANNQPWKAKLHAGHKEALLRGWQENKHTQVQREQRLLRELQQPDDSALGETLADERARLLKEWERQLDVLITSAA